MSVALHTPPATRQRTVAFVLDGTDLDAKLESFKDQAVAEFMKVQGDIGALQTEALNSVSQGVFDAAQEDIYGEAGQLDAAFGEFGGHAIVIADKVTQLEVLGVNLQHRLGTAAADDVILKDKLQAMEVELQRWTNASAEQVEIITAMQ